MELKSGKNIFMLFSLILFFQEMKCACNSGNAVDFVTINSTKYDMNYASITSTGKRPYGYAKAIWNYNSPSSENPCIKVTGASNRRVEVMVESIPQSRLCVKDQNTEVGCADSGTGRLYSCKQAKSDTLYFEFYCDKQCGEHDVQFWYRIVLGQTPDQDPEDHWCDNRSHEEYPENLQELPPGFDFPMQSTTPISQAPGAQGLGMPLALILCAVCLLLIH